MGDVSFNLDTRIHKSNGVIVWINNIPEENNNTRPKENEAMLEVNIECLDCNTNTSATSLPQLSYSSVLISFGRVTDDEFNHYREMEVHLYFL